MKHLKIFIIIAVISTTGTTVNAAEKVPKKYENIYNAVMDQCGKKGTVVVWCKGYNIDDMEKFVKKILPQTKKLKYNGGDFSRICNYYGMDYSGNGFCRINRNQLTYFVKMSRYNHKKIKKITKKLHLKSSRTSKRAKINKIVRYVSRNCKYCYKKSLYYNNQAINCFRGYSKCNGYSEAVNLLCRYNGIKSKLLYGATYSPKYQTHNFLRVKVSGKWEYCDPTWYDGSKNKKYILSKKLWHTHAIYRVVK